MLARKAHSLKSGSLAQVVEHLTFNQVVPGSNPGTLIDAQIAQLVEQRTENPRVDGSIPSGGTKVKSVEKCCVYQYFSALFSFFRAFCERRKPENKNIYLYSFVLRCTLFFGDSNTVRHTRFSEFHQCSWFFIRKGRFRGIFLQILLIAQREPPFLMNSLTAIALMDF